MSARGAGAVTARGARGGGLAERIAIVALAIAAIAFLGAGYTAARAEDDLANLNVATPRPGPAELARARELAATAGRATPGERRAILEAEMLRRGGERERATALLTAAVRREPDNAEAWLGLARSATDPALAERAAQRVGELVPPVPAP